MWPLSGQGAEDGVNAQMRGSLVNRLPITERWEVTMIAQNIRSHGGAASQPGPGSPPAKHENPVGGLASLTFMKQE